jgi:Ca2+-binding EF-hand superfamily protein
MRNLISAGAVLLLLAGSAAAQQSRTDRMVQSAVKWDSNGDMVFTCDEWKLHLGKIFAAADKNRDGFVDAQEFAAVRSADIQFQDADLGYFDDNRDGKLSRAEFVDKPSQFFLRFDLNRDCKVTLDEIGEATRGGTSTDRSKPVLPGPAR